MNGLRHMLSGINGCPELARVVWALMCIAYIVLAFLAWRHGDAWNPIEFATGATIVLGGGAGAIAGKDIAVAIAKGKTPSEPGA